MLRGVGALLCAVALLVSSSPAHARKLKDKDRTGVILGMVFGGVGLALGGLFAGVSAATSAEADELGTELRAKNYAQPCTSEPETCDDIDTNLHNRDDFGDASIIALSVGGGLIATTFTALIVILTDNKGRRGSVKPTVVATPHGVALQVSF